MFPSLSNNRLPPLMAFVILGFSLLPSLTLAATCCKCTAPADPKSTICINTIETECETMAGKSTNPDVKGLNCTQSLGASQCQPINSGGLCSGQPQEEFQYRNQNTGAGTKSSTIPLTPPQLGIPLPGLEFAEEVTSIDGQLPIPFFAQYVSAAYKLLIGISAIAAAIMIVYGGFMYIFAATGAKVKGGRQIIIDAIIGLVLVLGAYTILATVNQDVLDLKVLRVKQVIPIDFDFMANTEAGFKDGKSSAQNETNAARIPVPGRAPVVAGYQGEEVSIKGIVETGDTPSQRLLSYCTKPEDRAKLTTYNEKVQALVRAVLGFKKICVDEKSCAYVRGGITDLATGKVTAGAGDIPYYETFLKTRGGYEWPASCSERWNNGQTITAYPEEEVKKLPKTAYTSATCANGLCDVTVKPFSSFFYSGRSLPLLIEFEYGESKTCYGPIRQTYSDVLTKPMSEQGLFGGDCGTTLSAIYTCAGGKVGRPWQGSDTSLFNYINYGHLIDYSNTNQGSPGKDFVVWRAKNLADLDNQIKTAGGLKFGDIVVAGSGGNQHNFMFTGGRADVPFEIFEMGSGGENAKRACANVGGKAGTVCGMAIQGAGSLYDYIDHAGTTVITKGPQKGQRIGTSKWYPITIVRPYEYTPCTSKEQCGDNEMCLCGAKDPIRCQPTRECEIKNGQRVCKITGQECKCAMQNICRDTRKKSKDPLFCTNDEMCPKGEVCITKDTVKDLCGETYNQQCQVNFCYKSS